MDKPKNSVFTPRLKSPTSWHRAAMLISFFMVLLATSFIILLSRGVDKELSLHALRSDFHKEAEKLLVHIIEMDGAAYNLEIHGGNLFKQYFQKTKEDVISSINRLDTLSDPFPEIQNWLPALKLYIEKEEQVVEMTSKLKNKPSALHAALDGQLIHLLRLVSQYLETETNDLEHSHQGLDLLRAALSFAAIIACISTFLLAYVVYDRFRRDVYALRQYQEQLHEDNLLLEQRVELRTQELKDARAHAERERERAELLLQDASHRIGNSLATVSSLLGLQAKNTSNQEAKNALIAARDRIQNIGTAHRRLRLGSDGETAALDELLNLILHDIKKELPEDVAHRIQIDSYIEPWQIKARDATTLGIIMSEFLINAIKHAFPNERQGRIFIGFFQRDDGNLALIVEDNGAGMEETSAKNNESRGLGHLIAKQLCLQFGAQPYQEIPEGGGTRFVVPLPALTAEATLKNIEIKSQDTAQQHYAAPSLSAANYSQIAKDIKQNVAPKAYN